MVRAIKLPYTGDNVCTESLNLNCFEYVKLLSVQRTTEGAFINDVMQLGRRGVTIFVTLSITRQVCNLCQESVEQPLLGSRISRRKTRQAQYYNKF